MKEYQGMKIIGIDNGYGNIKTANCCFPAGLTAHDVERATRSLPPIRPGMTITMSSPWPLLPAN